MHPARYCPAMPAAPSYPTLSEHEWERADHVWTLLEEGKIERARIEIDALLAERPEQPDVRIVEAAVSLDEGRADRALAALAGAERSADPAFFFHLRGAALYELVRLEEARGDAERALAIQPDQAETHSLMARIVEFLGDAEAAELHARTAEELEPEGFPPALDVGDEEFDRLVEESLRELPAEVRKHLDELPVLVQPLPPREALTAEQPPLSPDILGLFIGRHLMERQHDDLPGAPGAIYLFRRNLLRACTDREELAREVRVTVLHEVGHLLGLDEDDLDRWGLA
ncbi:MAG TPA: metallopeptidase family protein [Candidatus Limnocylindria bacterium]|nr:metallopeptidase family protein [Candidatus Limnocylindria bacterium]